MKRKYNDGIADNGGAERRMTDQEVVRYLDLVGRRLKLSMSGVDWKPEYAQELEEIEKELAELIPLVEKERERFERRRPDDLCEHGAGVRSDQ